MMSAWDYYRRTKRIRRVCIGFKIVRWTIRIAIIIGIIRTLMMPLDEFASRL